MILPLSAALVLFHPFAAAGSPVIAEGAELKKLEGEYSFDKDGEQIETIEVPEGWTANVTFAGPERNLLFITASRGIYSLEMKVAGARPGGSGL